jgi:putative membrane protein
VTIARAERGLSLRANKLYTAIMSDTALAGQNNKLDRAFWVLNLCVSVLALTLLGYLLLIRRGTAGTGLDLRFMPAVNAGFNGLAGVLLVAGLIAIRSKNRILHRALMSAAFASSTLFLVGYLAYHSVHGNTIYQGAYKPAYYVLLATHIVASMPVVPLALAAFYFAFKQRFATHKRMTRWLFPIWLYVSVTGVLVFFVLRGSAPMIP